MQISHGETPKDTGKVLSRYGHGIAIRNCFYGIGNKYIREVAKYSDIPVINLQCDVDHPCQSIADLMTIREKFGKNLRGMAAVQALRESGGFAVTVTDAEILSAIPELARSVAVFAEPAGATAYAGLKKAAALGKLSDSDTIAMVITGNGLKDINSAMGAQEVARVAEELQIPEEKSILLQHMILSHHGEPEFGAAVRPVCAESELLSMIDMTVPFVILSGRVSSEFHPGIRFERLS